MASLIAELVHTPLDNWRRVNVHTPRGVYTRFKIDLVKGGLALAVEVGLEKGLRVDGRSIQLTTEDSALLQRLAVNLAAWKPRKPWAPRRKNRGRR